MTNDHRGTESTDQHFDNLESDLAALRKENEGLKGVLKKLNSWWDEQKFNEIEALLRKTDGEGKGE